MIPKQQIEMNIALVQCFSNLSVPQYEFIKDALPLKKQVLFSKYYREHTNLDKVKMMLPKDKHSEFDSLYKTNSLKETLKKLGYKKYDRAPENMEEKVLGYKLRRDYLAQLYSGKYGNFSDLLENIIFVTTNTTNALLLPASTLFSHKINSLQMYAMQSYGFPLGGQKVKNKKLLGENISQRQIIFPTDINTENVHSLLIPAKLVEAYQISESSKYYFGIKQDRTDTLFFFPEETCSFPLSEKGHISSVLPPQETEIFDNMFDFDVEFVNNFHTEHVDIWHEPVQVGFRGNTAYLKVPKPFLGKTGVESLYYQHNEVPTTPAFVLSYDVVGNLVYNKILFLEKKHHDSSEYSVVLVGEIPDQVESLPLLMEYYDESLNQAQEQDQKNKKV